MQRILTIGRAAVTLALLATAACASARPSSDGPFDASVPIEVTNHNWSTIAVYALDAGVRSRIGTVESQQTETLRLPWSSPASDVRLLIHPIGSTVNYLSPELTWPGDGTLQFTVEEELQLSHLGVR